MANIPTIIQSTALVVGGILALVQFYSNSQGDKVSRSIEFYREANSDRNSLNQDILRKINGEAISKYVEILPTIKDTKSVPERREIYSQILHNVINKPEIMGLLAHSESYYKRMLACININACEKTTAFAFLEDDATTHCGNLSFVIPHMRKNGFPDFGKYFCYFSKNREVSENPEAKVFRSLLNLSDN
jgi:hypothetical protein